MNMIRTATEEDTTAIMDIIGEARMTMVENGNATQWPEGYPSDITIADDIKSGVGRIICEDGVAVAYFAFKPSPDPTYQTIYDGTWIDNKRPYYVIHRIAARRGTHGIIKQVFDYCFSQTDNIRIDTHRDNTIMQHLLKKYGFTYCGIIHLSNGEERLAYQKIHKRQKYTELSLFTEEESQENTVTPAEKTYDLDPLFDRLAQSTFRSRFRLTEKDREYIRVKGFDTIRQHARDFVARRLAPDVIPNDGKQTPMKGHPVFLAQHATACCCRGCFAKWHHIPAGRALTAEEQNYAVAVLMAWIKKQIGAQ